MIAKLNLTAALHFWRWIAFAHSVTCSILASPQLFAQSERKSFVFVKMGKVTKTQAVGGSALVIATVAIILLLLVPLNNQLRRAPLTSTVCSKEQLEQFSCILPNHVAGATVCRAGFNACVAPGEHLADDICGSCEEAVVKPALCSNVELSNYQCYLNDEVETPGVLVCDMGFTACRGSDLIQEDTKCGCCPGDKSDRCQVLKAP